MHCGLLLLLTALIDVQALGASPLPSPWPQTFHAHLRQNRNGTLAIDDLYYDWTRGRNMNLIQALNTPVLYDNEQGNGTTYYYTPDTEKCECMTTAYGLLRPDWLDGATYNGTDVVNEVPCNVWSHGTAITPYTGYFVTYYEHLTKKVPVRWLFYDGATFDVISWNVNKTLKEQKWQLPDYCFEAPCRKISELSLGSSSHILSRPRSATSYFQALNFSVSVH